MHSQRSQGPKFFQRNSPLLGSEEKTALARSVHEVKWRSDFQNKNKSFCYSSSWRVLAMSMTKQYLTFAFSSLSIAVLTYGMGIFSIIAVTLCFPAKSSICCVSQIPLIVLPPIEWRPVDHATPQNRNIKVSRTFMNTQILAPMGKKLELWEGNYEFAKKPKNSGFLHKQILVKYRWLTRDDHWHESSKASLEYPLWQASHLSSAASSMDPRSEHMQLCQECNPLTWQQPVQSVHTIFFSIIVWFCCVQNLNDSL